MSDAAIASIVTGVVTVSTMVVGFLTLWIRIKYDTKRSEYLASSIESKVDINTADIKDTSLKISKNALEAVASAKEAASKAKSVGELVTSNAHNTILAAEEAARKVDVVISKLNGGLDSAISSIISPITTILESHSNRLENMDKYVHERNHDILTALQIQSNKLDTLMMMMKDKTEGE